jgi:hypothetical protein
MSPDVSERSLDAAIEAALLGLEKSPDGDLFVRSGPGSVALASDSAREYIKTRFPGAGGAPADTVQP